MSADPVPSPPPEHARRLRWAAGGLATLLALLLAALAYRQLYRSADYASRERRQNRRLILEPAPRGTIFDREGRVLAGNRTRTAAVLWPGELREEFRRERNTQRQRFGPPQSPTLASPEAEARAAVVQRYLDAVSEIVGRPAPFDRQRLEQIFARERIQPFVLVDDLTAEEAAALQARLPAAGPVRLQTTATRFYPQGRTAAHVLGRMRTEVLREPNRPNLIALNYRAAVGVSGVEREFETRLRGKPGETVNQIDALGFRVDEPLERRLPVAGEDLWLSIDLDVQRAMEESLRAAVGSSRGAAVALAIATGEVLALASRPDFNPAGSASENTSGAPRPGETDGDWFNRATQGLYAPGSTFKVFTMLAGLRAGTLQPGSTLTCRGFHDVAGHRFRCHRADGHGDLQLARALAQSCNVFAYQVGLAAGADALVAEARRFHFDEPTGVELPDETNRMLVADPAWKSTEGRGAWSLIDTANLAIGQGFLRISPLQAACAVASLARGESLTVPTLLLAPSRRPSGDRALEPLALPPADYAALIEGMRAVTEHGIGSDAQIPGISMAGKTGTAQVVRAGGMQNIAWFIAFAPVEKPEIAIAVALEGDQLNQEYAGAEHAAPVVRETLAAYFDKQTRKRP